MNKIVDIKQLSNKNYIEICKWCVKTLGPINEKWRLVELRYLVFEEEKYATMAVLKWS
jgi:hypothetical protein